MKKTIYIQDFIDAFTHMGRGDSFSEDGYQALFDHLEELERGTGKEIELDVIALCGDYSEVDEEEYQSNYSRDNLITELGNGNYLVRDC